MTCHRWRFESIRTVTNVRETDTLHGGFGAGGYDDYDEPPLPSYLDPRVPADRARRPQREAPGATALLPPRVDQPRYDPPQVPPAPPPPVPSADAPKPRRKRRGLKITLSILLVLVLAIVGFGAYLDFNLNRQDVLADYAGRPAASAGTNWLMIGSDSRAGLTDAQKQQLATGNAEGSRTDTIMLLHVPDSGVPPTLVSLPRDTLVDIPGHGQQKLNAAFSIGGAKLLAQTVEKLTNLRINHYAEIGFGGFAGVVDAVGGVDICVDAADRRSEGRAEACRRMPDSRRFAGAGVRAYPRERPG